MRMGVHKGALNQSVTDADDVLWYQPANVDWAMDEVVNKSPVPAKLLRNLDELIHCAISLSEANTHIVIMSNGGFGGVHQRLIEQLTKHAM
jgi:UDP-N-acetylmuramate: L-alanyl-gamma-D-glutamyl-meso-diaminopimelate ligase